MPVPTLADIRIWPISLEQIEATVEDYLGPGRVRNNSPAPVFSRHVSMYLARRVGGWSYPKISRFYNRQHYTRP
jgi:chromosomal replication initiation ATPase DnaA